MTLTITPKQGDDYREPLFNMPEANASRGGGNDIEIRDDGMSGFYITLDNRDVSVDITHKTARMLFYALAGSSNAEYFLYDMIRSNLNRVHYKELWISLGQGEAQRDNA